MDILEWEILHLHLKLQTKTKSYQKPNSFPAFDVLGFVPKSLKHLIFQWSTEASQSFLWEHSSLWEHYLTERTSVAEGRRETVRGNFHLIIRSPFPSFPRDVHSQALQCNYSSKCLDSQSLEQWGKLSTAAWHLLFFQRWFLPFPWSNKWRFFWLLLAPWRTLLQLPTLHGALLTENIVTCQVLIFSLGPSFPFPTSPIIFFFKISKTQKSSCTKEISALPSIIWMPTETSALRVLEINDKLIQSRSHKNILEFFGLMIFLLF